MRSPPRSVNDSVKFPTRGSAGRTAMGVSGSLLRLYTKPTNKLRGSGKVCGGAGMGTGEGIMGGAGMRGVAKCTRTENVLAPSSARVASKDELLRSRL